MTTLLVSGPRDWEAREDVWYALEAFQAAYGLHEVVHGGARGADAAASAFLAERPEVEETVFPADWDRYGKAAGPRRNQAMVEYVVGQVVEHGVSNVFAMVFHPEPDLWTPGTSDTYRRLRAAAEVTPVLVTHVTRSSIYEEALP